MKKILLLFVITLFSKADFAQVVIYGKAKNIAAGKTVKVTYYNNTIEELEQVADSSHIKADGSFYLKFGWNKFNNAKLEMDEQYTNIFLEPKDNLGVNVDYKNFDSTIIYSGKGAANNNYKAKEMFKKFVERPHKYNEIPDPIMFRRFIDSLQQDEKDFFAKNYSPEMSKEFVHQIKLDAQYRYVYVLGLLNVGYNRETKTFYNKHLPESYYSYLKAIDLTDETALDNGNYTLAVENYIAHYNPLHDTNLVSKKLPELEQEEKSVGFFYNYQKQLLKGKIRAYFETKFLKDGLSKVAVDKHFTDLLWNDFKQINTDPFYEVIIKSTLEKLQQLKKGMPAPDFNLLAADGKNILLKNLKGKLIYIDFWATWCAPCMAEMPHSKQLAEELKNENVQFVYINVNDDKQKWSDYFAKEKRDGLYLFADEPQSAKLRSDYNFNGIPHYALIDKNGKIIDADAERPSGKAKQEILENLKN